MITKRNRQAYLKRKFRIRRKVHGTPQRPRLTVFRSAKHIYAQIIDDESGKTIASASSIEKEIRDEITDLKKADVAEKVGSLVAERCLAKNVNEIVFDRNGFVYHGRVAKLADGARKKGLKF